MKLCEVDKNELSPMMKEYVNTKLQYNDILLFYRLGDFYELFFEDAQIASRELELTLTGKNAGLKDRVPMCGVPYHAVNTYLEKLIDKGFKVAICEQMEDPKLAKGLVKREVTQIVSKGTITNSDALNENEYNYIGYLIDYKYTYALTYADILSGKIYTTFISYDIDKLINYLVNINIKELVVSASFDKDLLYILKEQYKIYISLFDEINSTNYFNILSNINDDKLVKCSNYLLTYIEEGIKKELSHFQKVEYVDNNSYMVLDKECIRNLELTETIRNKDRTYSLLGFLDKTKTAMGSRMLKEFVLRPCIDKSEISKRQDLIELFNKEFLLKSELSTCLYEIYDLERLCGKIVCSNLNGRDLLQLKNSVRVIPDINNILTSLSLQPLDTFEELYDLLDKSIDLDAPITIKEGNIIITGYNKELDELRNIRKNGKDFINKLEIEEKERTGIKNLKIGYNKVFGYYIEVSKGQLDNVKEEFGYIRKQTISNSERFINPLLKEKEDLILNAEDKINNLEYELFCEIKNQVCKYIPKLQIVASEIAYYDVVQSLSTISEETKMVRPIINDKNIIDIKDGRHPVVEKVIKGDYIANDIFLDSEENVLIITGPNMSGKSTYMRELAIIVILNQIGAFVPASYASLPIFDRIFTRIGASDDLVGGESTFMVEMKESANALRNATEHSLIIFDELGRGTSTYDGMSLAGSIIEFISKHIKCKTMFSTHYHELTKMSEYLNNVKNVHVKISENNGDIKFLHKVCEGPVDKSYGINVAKLANLPAEVITKANTFLNEFENNESNSKKSKQMELDLAENYSNEISEYLKKIDVLEITPLEALNILNELKSRSEK